MKHVHSLEDDLIDYGLTPKQARVYLAAMQLGAASVQDIASLAKTERTNTYDAIEALLAKRLMSATSAGKKRLYAAEPPTVLKRLLDEKRAHLTHILPELESLYNISDNRPRIRYYPGLDGYKAVYDDTLSAKSKLLFGIYSVKDITDVLGVGYVDEMVERRVRAGITLRIIRSKEKEVGNIYPPRESEKREVRFAPEGMVFPIVNFVYDNKVIYLSSKKELFGMIIESADVAQAHKNYFDALWHISSQG